MTYYSLPSCHDLFFYYFELKKFSVQCNKEKKFKFIQFRKILTPSKAPRLRFLRMSKNPTNDVGP